VAGLEKRHLKGKIRKSSYDYVTELIYMETHTGYNVVIMVIGEMLKRKVATPVGDALQGTSTNVAD